MWSRVVKEPAFTRDDGAVEDGVDGEFDVAGGEGAAVVKAGVGAEVKDPGERVGGFPRSGEEGLEAEVLVAADEGVEEEGVDVLGLGVDADAGIEVGGAGLDEHGDGGGDRLCGAAAKEPEPVASSRAKPARSEPGTSERRTAARRTADAGFRHR